MFSFAMTFTSCSDEAFDVDSVNKQTILVYYPWTGSTTSSGLKQYLANNIDSICQAVMKYADAAFYGPGEFCKAGDEDE